MALAIAFILFGAQQSLKGPFYGLLFYLAMAYFRPETWVWSDRLQSLNLSFVIGVYVVVVTALSQRERLARTLPVFLIAGLCLHGFISTLLSQHYEWCYFWWKGFAKVSLITILIVSLVNTQERFRQVLIVISFSLGLESVKQGWMHLIVGGGGINLNGVEILGDNNGVAVGMLMLSAILLALYQTTSGAAKRGVFAFMAIGAVLRSVSTFSRGGLLSLAGLAVTYWARSTNKLATGAALAVVLGGTLAMMPDTYWTRMQTITADADERDWSAGSRLHFWQVATRMADDRPLFGVGPSGFERAYNAYDTADGIYGHNRAVHSTWFGMLADQGYIGLGLLITIIVLALRACGRARRLSKSVVGLEHTFIFAGAIQAALVSAVVGSTFLSYHYVEVLWHFLGLGFAIERIARAGVTSTAPVRASQPVPAFAPRLPPRAAALARR
jgi:probable O-glycosylation ligase (exosortase A-associated)